MLLFIIPGLLSSPLAGAGGAQRGRDARLPQRSRQPLLPEGIVVVVVVFNGAKLISSPRRPVGVVVIVC